MKTYEVRRLGGFVMATHLTWEEAKENAIAVANLFAAGKGYIYCEQDGKLVAIYHSTRH